ncbi:MAG: hypothetical protein FJY66_00160 [Calditrichaeota bacterium]|nr:hypothetical protein [Calditrichota bacterium]
MRKWLLVFVAAAFLAGFGLAYGGEGCGSHGSKGCANLCGGKSCTGQCSGKACTGKCGGKCEGKCDHPDWAYAYQSADFCPDAATKELKKFHSVLIPIREARKSGETAYVRENAKHLYEAAKQVKKSKPCVEKMQQKHYAKAASELAHDSKRLKELVHGGSDDAVMEQVTLIEEDFVRLINLSECH